MNLFRQNLPATCVELCLLHSTTYVSYTSCSYSRFCQLEALHFSAQAAQTQSIEGYCKEP
jgi:hypothetical protein